ncbi:MAG TPA: AtpZ/AtpI family protein [Myxococcota bacterium]|nr:AtpZ/AtpI family protein [Myxococcota bacterium]
MTGTQPPFERDDGRPDEQAVERPDARRALERDVGRYARREPSGATFWRSLSVLGTIGWSIALPAALGAWVGHRLDVRLGTGVRFTLMLLTAGVFVGSAVAWRVVRSHRD